MTNLIEYADKNHPDAGQWRVLLQNFEIFTGGLLLLGVENINDFHYAPVIRRGSRMDVNGSKYACITDEAVLLMPSPFGSLANNAFNYVYAVPEGDTASFVYSPAKPVWDITKGSWYREFNGKYCRAIVKFFYLPGTGYSNKVVLDSHNSMDLVNSLQSVPNEGGQLEVNKSGTGSDEMVSLAAGMYRYELLGGRGGRGGEGGAGGISPPVAGSGSHTAGASGARGPDGQSGGDAARLAGVFYHGGGTIRVKAGKDGGRGGRGGKGGDGGINITPGSQSGGAGSSRSMDGGDGGPGGGGGAGEESRIGDIVSAGGIAGTGTLTSVSAGEPGRADGIGGRGGEGADGEERSSANGQDAGPGEPGQFGSAPSGAASGYARIFRVG